MRSVWGPPQDLALTKMIQAPLLGTNMESRREHDGADGGSRRQNSTLKRLGDHLSPTSVYALTAIFWGFPCDRRQLRVLFFTAAFKPLSARIHVGLDRLTLDGSAFSGLR